MAACEEALVHSHQVERTSADGRLASVFGQRCRYTGFRLGDRVLIFGQECVHEGAVVCVVCSRFEARALTWVNGHVPERPL